MPGFKQPRPKAGRLAGVYEIVDPRNDCVFYVGLTYDHDRRSHSHLWGKVQSTRARIAEIRAATGTGPQFAFTPISGDYAALRTAEMALIAAHARKGTTLCNPAHDVAQAVACTPSQP